MLTNLGIMLALPIFSSLPEIWTFIFGVLLCLTTSDSLYGVNFRFVLDLAGLFFILLSEENAIF